jgi:NADP-dependent 3-hydroxy acid dehydrogenase YdfG
MAEKKIALITGAGGGIGRIAKTLAVDGFTVICVDKNAKKAEEVCSSNSWLILVCR